MADDVRDIVRNHGTEEIAFVGMRPFYGLSLYLGIRVENVHIEGAGLEYSKFLSEETLCHELSVREKSLFAVKRKGSDRFLAVSKRCTELVAVEVGSFEADDNEIALYRMQPASPAPQPG